MYVNLTIRVASCVVVGVRFASISYCTLRGRLKGTAIALIGGF